MITEFVSYGFGIFRGIIGRTPDKRIPEGLFFAHQNRIRFIFFEFLKIVEGLSELVIYFFKSPYYRPKVAIRLKYTPLVKSPKKQQKVVTELVIYVFGVFIGIIGGWDP